MEPWSFFSGPREHSRLYKQDKVASRPNAAASATPRRRPSSPRGRVLNAIVGECVGGAEGLSGAPAPDRLDSGSGGTGSKPLTNGRPFICQTGSFRHARQHTGGGGVAARRDGTRERAFLWVGARPLLETERSGGPPGFED